MNKKYYLFLLLLLLISVISISAVSAEDDFKSDIINSNDNQEINLEENIPGDISANNEDNGELSLEKNTSTDVDDKRLGSGDKTGDIPKENSTKASKKVKTVPYKKTSFKTIGKNSKDKATVKKIQWALKNNGYYLRYQGHYLKVDGWFGPCTEKSVKQFQKANKLKVTGKVDEKTAEKLKIIDRSNAKIKFRNDNAFKGEYMSGKSFVVHIVNKTTGRGIDTILRVDYYRNGKIVDYEYYCTDDYGINYITPDKLRIGTYKVKVSCSEPNIKVEPKYKTITIKKTSIILKAKGIASGNQNIQLKAKLNFKNNAEVNEGKVKFAIDGKTYIVKVHNGVAIKNLKLKKVKSNKYQVTFLGTNNIKVKSVTGKIS